MRVPGIPGILELPGEGVELMEMIIILGICYAVIGWLADRIADRLHRNTTKEYYGGND